MLTVDELKKNSRNPYYSGVGFIKLNTDEGIYRFYCAEIERTVDTIHTHMNSFSSELVKGTLRNFTYDVVPVEYETDYKLTQGACMPGAVHTTVHENVLAIELPGCDTTEGNSYINGLNVPHRVKAITPKAITRLSMIERNNCELLFVVNKRIPHIEPWDTKKSVEECWEIIEYVLKD